MTYLRRHGEVSLFLIAAVTAGLLGAAQALPPMGLAQQFIMIAVLIFWTAGFAWCVFKSEFPFFRRYKLEIGITLLVLYAISLALVTVSELFDLGWFSWL